jgi:hypothetical protein
VDDHAGSALDDRFDADCGETGGARTEGALEFEETVIPHFRSPLPLRERVRVRGDRVE